jgi:DNA helicase-2/ATP-dependent DNA helicase PcrA
LDFPHLFPGTRIVRLEENYRSVQPVLDMANALLENAPEGYHKTLFSRREIPADNPVCLYRPFSDHSQGQLAARRVEELLETCQPQDIAVLFRAGYQSYHLEVELNKRGIRFRKYGGLRYAEASHVKDVLAFARLVINPLDFPSFERVSALTKGIGPKTARKLYDFAVQGKTTEYRKAGAKYPDFLADMAIVDSLRASGQDPASMVISILEHYRPRMETLYPDDWPRRMQGLEELLTISLNYDDLALFIGDLSLESPEEQEMEEDNRRITLSTIHSAKGLEWSAVLILDLVEDRFPSRHALSRPDDFEEERRLMYVACTRAKDTLDLFMPMTLFNRQAGGQEHAVPSPFVRELPWDKLHEIYEGFGGVLSRRRAEPGKSFLPPSFLMEQPDPEEMAAFRKPLCSVREELLFTEERQANPKPALLGFCRHKIFGRGKIVESLPPDKYRVNFPGIGLKVILAAYVTLED